MAKTLHKIAAAVLAGCMLFGTASVWAAPATDRDVAKLEAKAAKQQAKEAKKLAKQQAKQQKKLEKAEKARKVVADTVLYAEIIGYEQGNVYLLEDGNGDTVRADLGENGGRLSGTFGQDTTGRLFKMVSVEYKDPKYGNEHLRGQGTMSVTSHSKAGDAALYRGKQVPTDNSNYITQNLSGVSDVSAYRKMAAAELNNSAVGTKASLVGRPIETVSKIR